MGLGGLVRSITKPIQSVASSISDIPGSIKGFVDNPLNSIGEGIGNAYMLPGRALGSDELTNAGGALGAAQAGLLGGPNAGKAAGRATGNERIGQVAGRGAVTAAALLAAAYGGSALMGAGAGSGAGSGGMMGLKAGGSTLGSTSYGGGLGLTSGGGLGLSAGSGGASALGASSPSFLSSLGSSALAGAGKVGGFLASPTGALLGLGALDMHMRNQQMEDLERIARESAEMADAFRQPQRFPYQGLLQNYLQDGQSIADQPYVKANMDFALQRAAAEMARTGRSGGGGVGRELVDYASNVFESNALPYLNQLSGMAGFGFGPGASGQLYGQYGSMATGARFQGLDSLARAIGNTQPSVAPWQLAAFNAQQQMQGMGPGRNFTLS